MVLGGVLSLCNVYTALKIGWGTNMSITAAVAQWKAVALVFKDGLSNLPPMRESLTGVGVAVQKILAG
jgi:hypothetical protein